MIHDKSWQETRLLDFQTSIPEEIRGQEEKDVIITGNLDACDDELIDKTRSR